MSEIKANIRALADNLKSNLTIDPVTGVATPSDDWYASNLPEGLTVDTYKQLTEHNTDVLAAADLATGELGIETMKTHKDLQRVTMTLPLVGKDTINVVQDRTFDARNVKTGETTVKYGRTTASLDIYAADNGRGELKKVREHLYSVAASELAD